MLVFCLIYKVPNPKATQDDSMNQRAHPLRILIVSPEAFPGHEERNLPVAEELIRRGHEVIHTGPGKALEERGITVTTFEDSFAETPAAKRANTRLFSRWIELTDLIDWCQVALFGVSKDLKAVIEYAAREGKIILWHWDIAADHFRPHLADRIAVRGPSEKKFTADMAGISENKVVPLGCVQFDSAHSTFRHLNRTAFCQKYGLDENKKIAVFLSTAPANHHDMVKDNYRKICQVVLDLPGFELIIKPHPREYARNRQHYYYEDTETPTWAQLAPGTPVVEADDKYDCFAHAEILIGQRSCVFRESALFHIPLLEVSIIEARSHVLGIGKEEIDRLFPTKRFFPARRQMWKLFGGLESIIEAMPPNDFTRKAFLDIDQFKQLYGGEFPDFIGAFCSIEELPEVLASGAYRFDDAAVYDDYIAEYCVANDGKSYLRVADFVESVRDDPELAAKLLPHRGWAAFKSLVHRLARKILYGLGLRRD